MYGVAAILSRAVSLLLVPLLTRTLAPSDYGAVDILTLVGSLVALSVALEISQAVPRFFSDEPTPEGRIAYASTALWFTVAVYALVSVLAFSSAKALASFILGRPDYTPLLRAALAMYAATGIFYLVQGQLRWERRVNQYAIASVLSAAVSLAAVSSLMLLTPMRSTAVFVGQAIGNGIGAAAGFYLARHSFARVFDRKRCVEMLKFSAPLVPSGLAVFVALYSDRLIVQRILSLTEVGELGVGYRIASVVGLIVVGFQSALTPILFARFRERETPNQLARIFGAFCAFALLVCTALGMFAREIVVLLTSPRYYHAATVVPLLAPAVLLANMYVFAPGLVITKRTGRVALLNFGGAALNVALNLLLVPILGITGAATATLTSSAVTFAGYMVASQRSYPVPHYWGRLAASLSVSVAAGITGFLLGGPSPLLFIIKLGLFGIVAVAFFKLQLVKTSELAAAISMLVRRAAVRPGASGSILESSQSQELPILTEDIDGIQYRADTDR